MWTTLWKKLRTVIFHTLEHIVMALRKEQWSARHALAKQFLLNFIEITWVGSLSITLERLLLSCERSLWVIRIALYQPSRCARRLSLTEQKVSLSLQLDRSERSQAAPLHGAIR